MLFQYINRSSHMLNFGPRGSSHKYKIHALFERTDSGKPSFVGHGFLVEKVKVVQDQGDSSCGTERSGNLPGSLGIGQTPSLNLA